MAQRNVLEHYIAIKRTEERTGNKGLFIHIRSLPCEEIVVSFPPAEWLVRFCCRRCFLSQFD